MMIERHCCHLPINRLQKSSLQAVYIVENRDVHDPKAQQALSILAKGHEIRDFYNCLSHHVHEHDAGHYSPHSAKGHEIVTELRP
jgi:hypothetical protein